MPEYKLQMVLFDSHLDSCLLKFKCCVVYTYIKKIMHYMTLLCVQGPEVWRCGRTIKVPSGELTVEGRYMVLVSQAFELVENFIIGTVSYTHLTLPTTFTV